MKGHPKVIEALKELLKCELTAINQSFLHARMCLDWGYNGLAMQIRKDSITKMVHAEQLIDRILFLEKIPNLASMFKLGIGKDVAKIHVNDLMLATRTADCANLGIKTCTNEKDDTSRELIEAILKTEEDLIDWLESQLQVIEDTSLGLYLSQQMNSN